MYMKGAVQWYMYVFFEAFDKKKKKNVYNVFFFQSFHLANRDIKPKWNDIIISSAAKSASCSSHWLFKKKEKKETDSSSSKKKKKSGKGQNPTN